MLSALSVSLAKGLSVSFYFLAVDSMLFFFCFIYFHSNLCDFRPCAAVSLVHCLSSPSRWTMGYRLEGFPFPEVGVGSYLSPGLCSDPLPPVCVCDVPVSSWCSWCWFSCRALGLAGGFVQLRGLQLPAAPCVPMACCALVSGCRRVRGGVPLRPSFPAPSAGASAPLGRGMQPCLSPFAAVGFRTPCSGTCLLPVSVW